MDLSRFSPTPSEGVPGQAGQAALAKRLYSLCNLGGGLEMARTGGLGKWSISSSSVVMCCDTLT
jgi:hypothetical protein